MGLGDGARAELESALAEAEARALAEEIEELLDECGTHSGSGRLAEALDCYREVLKLDGEHEQAAAEEARIAPLVVWRRVQDGRTVEGTVEGYFRFVQLYPGSN